MKHLMRAALLCLIPLLGFSQQTDYSLFELFYFTPAPGQGASLEKAMSEHNKKYHPVGDYSAQVYSVINGPNAGKYVWSMGPTTWTKIETRPAEEGHDTHWDEQVGIHIESYDATDFYKLEPDMSYFPGPFDLKILRLWQVDIKSGQQYRFDHLIESVLEVYNKNEYKTPMGLYDRQLSGTHGPDATIIWFLPSLEWLDMEGTFAKDYDALHGEGAMDNLMEEWDDIVDRMDVELWRFEPDMSGHDGTAVSRGRQ